MFNPICNLFRGQNLQTPENRTHPRNHFIHEKNKKLKCQNVMEIFKTTSITKCYLILSRINTTAFAPSRKRNREIMIKLRDF
jgi:hypothetical protein